MDEALLLLVTAAAYLLGALPLADQISRRRGVDIFSSGTGLTGASNVLRSVGKRPAAIVIAWDVAKGALAVFWGQSLGVDGHWILLPALATIIGHWKSVFSGFRGGDGLAVLGGITIALFPIYGPISVMVAILVSLGGQRLPYTSLLSVAFGYLALVLLNITNDGDLGLTFGAGALSAFVLAHASLGHRRRRRTDWQEAGQPEAPSEEPRLEH